MNVLHCIAAMERISFLIYVICIKNCSFFVKYRLKKRK